MAIFKPDATLADKIWIAIGFVGQAMFFGRFFVQWIASERARRVVIPLAFWILSLLGGGILLAYALYIRDPVFIVGQAMGFLIYSRNLYFHLKNERPTPGGPATAGGAAEP